MNTYITWQSRENSHDYGVTGPFKDEDSARKYLAEWLAEDYPDPPYDETNTHDGPEYCFQISNLVPPVK